jgi:hypothetical protein
MSEPGTEPSETPTETPLREPSSDPSDNPPETPSEDQATIKEKELELREGPVNVSFNLNGPKDSINEGEKAPIFTTLEQEWKYYHDKLKHPPNTRMLWMAKQGIIPRRLLKLAKTPACAGCLIWKATRRPW